MEKLYQDKEWLYEKYIVEKLSTRKIANICKCSHTTIIGWLDIYRITARTKSETMLGKKNRYRPLAKRFWEKVDKNGPNGCWIWVAHKDKNSYGRIDGKYAHIISWELNNSPILNSLHVLHHCDNPACVNPDHLFLGTHQDNMKDMIEKNRQAKGEKNGMSKLTEKIVLEIRADWATGKYTQQKLAKKYNNKRGTVCDVIKNKTWKHI